MERASKAKILISSCLFLLFWRPSDPGLTKGRLTDQKLIFFDSSLQLEVRPLHRHETTGRVMPGDTIVKREKRSLSGQTRHINYF